jgi:hypothetical protein
MYRLLVGEPDGNRPLEKPRRKLTYNIKMDLLEMGLSVVDWIGLAQEVQLESSSEGGSETCCYNMLENYRMAAKHVVPRVVLSSTELVS